MLKQDILGLPCHVWETSRTKVLHVKILGAILKIQLFIYMYEQCCFLTANSIDLKQVRSKNVSTLTCYWQGLTAGGQEGHHHQCTSLHASSCSSSNHRRNMLNTVGSHLAAPFIHVLYFRVNTAADGHPVLSSVSCLMCVFKLNVTYMLK